MHIEVNPRTDLLFSIDNSLFNGNNEAPLLLVGKNVMIQSIYSILFDT